MSRKPMIIGIAGPSASGKSLLANTIVEELGSREVAIIPEDAYYAHHPEMSKEERAQINFDHPSAFDHDLLIEHLKTLQEGRSIDIPQYDFSEHLRSDKVIPLGPHSIIVLEGILLFAVPRLRELMDIRIYMDAPLDICLIRRLLRDMEERGRSLPSVLEQYQKTVRPMYFQFIEPSRLHSDIIIPRGGENRIAIETIKAKLREMLAEMTAATS